MLFLWNITTNDPKVNTGSKGYSRRLLLDIKVIDTVWCLQMRKTVDSH